MYIYICIYTFLYIYVYICLCIYEYKHIHIKICVKLYIYIQQCIAHGSAIFPCIIGSSLCIHHKCSVDHCIEKKSDPLSSFCIDHTCHVCSESQGEQLQPSTPPFGLCPIHQCLNKTCQRRRVSVLFCREHTCRLCIDNISNLAHLITDPVVERAPRNICAKHVLCNHVFKGGNLCLKVLPFLSDIYCASHLEGQEKKDKSSISIDFLRCFGVNSKGNCCGTHMHMNICTYVYMYTYIYMDVYVYIYINIYAHKHVFLYIYIYMFIYI
jgi:hypothetical protein